MKRKLFSILLALAMIASLGLATVPVAAAGISVTAAPEYAPAEAEIPEGEGVGIPATIDPVGAEYDLYAPGDITTTVTLNDATVITEVNDGTNILTVDVDYTFDGTTLTIPNTFLAGKLTAAGQYVIFNIFFDVGAATLTVTAVDNTPVPAALNPTEANYDLFANDDVVTDITWNGAASVTSVVDGNAYPLVLGADYTVTLPVVAGEGQIGDAILTIVDSSYLWWNLDEPGESVVLTVNFDTGAPATFTITAVWGGISATISPETADYNVSAPADATTSVTYNDAGAITTIVDDDAYTLILNTDYTLLAEVSGEGLVPNDTLTILNSYLAGKLITPGDTVVLTINFTNGNSATFTITATWSGLSADLDPDSRNFNIFFPGNDDDVHNNIWTNVNFNDAGDLVSIYNGNDDLVEGYDYEIFTEGEGLGEFVTVHIFNDYLAGQLLAEGDQIVLTFNFQYGAPAYFTINAIATVHNITQDTYYITIQEAINVANSGDVIEVGAGLYEENLNIQQDLTLQTTGNDDLSLTIIQGSYEPVINIGDYNVTIDGFSIVSAVVPGVEGGPVGTGVIYVDYISNGNTVNIQNNGIDGAFTPNCYGIYVNTVFGTLNITNNYVEQSYYGIYVNTMGYIADDASESGNADEEAPAETVVDGVNQAATVNILDNTVYNAYYGIYPNGMYLGSIAVNGNTITDCYYGVYGDETGDNGGYAVNYAVRDNIITLGIFTEAYGIEGVVLGGYGIYLCCVEQTTYVTGNTISGPYQAGINMMDLGCCGANPSIVYIEDNVISCWRGFEVNDCGPVACCQDCYLYIRDNSFTGNDDIVGESYIGNSDAAGIWLDTGVGDFGEDTVGFVEISGNSFSNISNGIYIWDTNNDSTVLIQNNTFFNTYNAVYSEFLTEGTFSVLDNDIENSYYGVHFSEMGHDVDSLANILVGNNTITGGYYGVYAESFYYGAIDIFSNILTNCYYGIYGDETGDNDGSEVSYQVRNNTITYGNDDDAVEGFTGVGEAIYLCCVEKTTWVTGNIITGPYSSGIEMYDIGCCGADRSVVHVENNVITGCFSGFIVTGCGPVACCRDADLYVRNNTFNLIYWNAIDLDTGVGSSSYNAYVEISGNTMNTGGPESKGIYIDSIDNSTVDIFNNTIDGFGYGIDVETIGESFDAELNIDHNNVSNCWDTGIYVYDLYHGSIAINSNTVTDCYDGIYCDEGGYDGAATNYQIMFNTVTYNPVLAGEGEENGVNNGIYICCPEYVTYIQGNIVSGYYYGIELDDIGCCGSEPGLFYVDSNQVTDCYYGFYLQDLFCCIPGTFYFRYNTASDNVYGLYVNSIYSSTTPEACELYLGNNDFTGNSSFGVYNNDGEYDLDARYNWWGSDSGPTHATNIGGSGDVVSDYVIFDPWLTTTPPVPVSIVTMTLPYGVAGLPYVAYLNAVDGTEPYNWSLFFGTLPDGLGFDGNAIIGNPTETGSFAIDVLVTDADGITDVQSFVIDIYPPYAGPGGGGGGGGGNALSPSTGLTGSNINLDGNGVAQNTGVLTSLDGNVKITVPAGTTLRDANGNPLGSMTCAPVADPPAPPEGADLLLAYTFGPAGATFSPPISITFTYDPATLPPGAAEDGLTVAYWDGTQWLTVPAVIDPVNNTITIQVSHYSTYAILAQIPVTTTPVPTTTPPAPTTTPPAPTTTSPAPTTTSPAPTTTSPAPTTTSPAPTTTSSVVTTETPVPAATNWGLIIGIIGGVIVVALIIVLVVRARKRE